MIVQDFESGLFYERMSQAASAGIPIRKGGEATQHQRGLLVDQDGYERLGYVAFDQGRGRFSVLLKQADMR